MKPGHMEAVLSSQLRSTHYLQTKLDLAARVLGTLGDTFDDHTVEVLADEIGPALDGWIDTVPETVNAAYLRALTLSRLNRKGASVAWKRFFSLSGKHKPFHLLAYAQALVEEQRFAEAALPLRSALTQGVPYSFFARAEKVIEEIASHNPSFVRQSRIAVLSRDTTSLLIPVLKALCLRDRIQATFYQGIYGAVEQEVLDPQSGLAAFRPDVVFLIQHWRDLPPSALTTDEKGIAARVIDSHKVLWQRLSDQFGCHIVQLLFDFPNEDAFAPFAPSRPRLVQLINSLLLEEASSCVSFLDTPAIQRRFGERWDDPMLWFSFRQHPSTEALPDLAEAYLAHLRAILGLTRKVLVTDLDNTLWNGVIAEDGLNGIKVGPGTAVGEAHQSVQQYLLDLKNRGILLAACSKNNPQDARLPFEKHEHMKLRLQDFSVFLANWEDKAQNLRHIAQKLSLGLDSFVFLDDDPMEREWVRSQIPEVAVVDLGSPVFQWVRQLDRGYHFYSSVLSKEDLARPEQIRCESQRELLRTASQSLDEFLSNLQLQASVVSVSESNLERVTQLINKTNQFNLTTKRYTTAQVLQIASSHESWTGAFELRDRMGNYGIVGVILCKPGSSSDQWGIDTWLISCRALGRQLEFFMFDRIIEAALMKGITRIEGTYRPTPKNRLVANLYEKLGFQKVHERSDEIVYSIDVPASLQVTATHVRNMNTFDSEQNQQREAALI